MADQVDIQPQAVEGSSGTSEVLDHTTDKDQEQNTCETVEVKEEGEGSGTQPTGFEPVGVKVEVMDVDMIDVNNITVKEEPLDEPSSKKQKTDDGSGKAPTLQLTSQCAGKNTERKQVGCSECDFKTFDKHELVDHYASSHTGLYEELLRAYINHINQACS